MLAKRLLASTLMIGLLIGGLALDVYFLQLDLCFLLLVVLLMLGGAHEFYRLAEAEGARPWRQTGMLACALLTLLTWLAIPHSSAAWPRLSVTVHPLTPVVGFAAATIVPFLLAMRRPDLQGVLRDLSVTTMGVVYIWFLCGFMLLVRHVGAGGIDFDGSLPAAADGSGPAPWLTFGQRLVVAVVVAAKSVDTGGYTVGRLIGRHKLIPTVSPGKTVEGLFGGVVFTLSGIGLMKYLGYLDEFSWSAAAGFAVVVGLAGMFGDLAESALKRSSGAKDAGATIPGFGGLLDVIDSFMFACPAAFLYVWLYFQFRTA